MIKNIYFLCCLFVHSARQICLSQTYLTMEGCHHSSVEPQLSEGIHIQVEVRVQQLQLLIVQEGGKSKWPKDEKEKKKSLKFFRELLLRLGTIPMRKALAWFSPKYKDFIYGYIFYNLLIVIWASHAGFQIKYNTMEVHFCFNDNMC